MILFKEVCYPTLEDVRWLRKNLGRRLEDCCLRAVEPKLSDPCAASSLIGSVLMAVTEIANNIVQHSTPRPTFISLEVGLAGSALRIEIADDGGPFHGFSEAFELAKRLRQPPDFISGRGLSVVGQNLQNVEYYAGNPNRFIGWRRLKGERPSILLLNNNAGSATKMLEILRKGYEVTCAQSAAEAQYIVDCERIEAIIVEYEVCMEEHALFKLAVDREPVPIIMLASTKDCESIIKKPVPHVDQCLQKPVSASKLICALEIAIASYTRRLIHLANSFGRSAGVLLADQLPREFPGFKLEVLSGTATYGGGDFALALSGQGFMRLVLADIMGHGLPAKAAAISLSSIIRTLHCQSAMTSDNLLQSISHMVGREPSFDGIISTLIIVDAANDGRVDAACAGHPPIAIISSERSFVLPCTGPLPGLVSAPDYQLASHRLQVGDRIVIVSDGIDHQSAATANFPDRLLKKLSMKPSLPLQTLKEDMEQWLLEQLGPAPKDDWTLMIGEYCGVSDRPN